MITYVPTSNATVALTLSDALWGLTRPPAVRDVKDTTRLFGTLRMSDASVWLVVDTEFTIPVHALADVTPIAEILEPFVEAGAIEYYDLIELFDLIEVTRGAELNIWESFPQYWMDLAKDEAELQTLNLWPVP